MMDVLIMAISRFFFYYWAILLIFVFFGFYWILQRRKAEQILLGLMLRAEKDADVLFLQTGEEKFEWVVEKSWELLPEGAKVFIPMNFLNVLTQTLYEKARDNFNSLNLYPAKPEETGESPAKNCSENKCSRCSKSCKSKPGDD